MKFETVIIGAGPAGTGIFFKALRDGSIHGLLNRGIGIIEQGTSLVSGSIVSYKIKSDSVSGVFLECLEGQTSGFLDLKCLEAELNYLKQYSGRPIPLKSLALYFDKLGDLLGKFISTYPNCKTFLNTRVLRIQQISAEEYRIFTNNSNTPIISRNIVLSTGGIPRFQNSFETKDGDQIQLTHYNHKIVSSDSLLKGTIPASAHERLLKNPNIVILGSGPSGFAAANYILNNFKGIDFLKNPIKIIGKKNPKLFFDSMEDAIANKYFEFGAEDFCSQTKRLFRLAGLRMDSKELYMRMTGMIANETEERVILNLGNTEETTTSLEKSGLIVLSLGYTFNTIPITTMNSDPIILKGTDDGRFVNDNLQLLSRSGSPIKNMYSIGLGNGYIPYGDLGGEPSFKGQFSGVWYYQNEMGKIILDQLLS
jgi:hypothetical protein